MVIKMDVKDLKYFLAVAQEGTVTKASKKLCISQPPLSRQLKDLEDELGVTLFYRGKKHIELSEEGVFLKQQAEEILSLIDITENQLKTKSDGTHGTVSLGVTEGCGAGVLSDIIMEFHEKYPYISFDVWCSGSQEIGERLSKGLCDIGFVREPFNATKFDSTPLRKEAWIIIMGKNHPLARDGKNEIELSQLSDEQLIIPSRTPMVDELNGWFNEQGAKRKIICRYNTLASILPLIENNLGVGVTTESTYHFTSPDKFAYKQIVNPKRFSNLLIIKRRNKIMSAPASLFWSFVQNGAEFFQNS